MGNFGRAITFRTRRDLGRVRPWGNSITAWRKKQIRNIKLLSRPIKYFFEFPHLSLDFLSESDLCFLLTVIKELIGQFCDSF